MAKKKKSTYRKGDRFMTPDEFYVEAHAYAHDLLGMVQMCARRRQPLEQEWYNDHLQHEGVYDDETRSRLEKNPNLCKLFVNKTRPKTRVLKARLADILFPNKDYNWDIEPTPVPSIEKMVEQDEPDPQEAPMEHRAYVRARKVRDAAREKAEGMKREMRDQLEECDYEFVGIRVIEQLTKYGVGVCKGPFADWRRKEKWVQDENGDWRMKDLPDDRPAYEFVDLWTWFPDMDATTPENIEYCFELHRMSRTDLQKLAKRDDFDSDAIRRVIRQKPDVADGIDQFTKYLKIVDDTYEDGQEQRYHVFEYHGPIPYDTFKMLMEAYGNNEIEDPMENPDDPLETFYGVVWFAGGTILKVGYSPDEAPGIPYSMVRMDPTNASLWSPGVPRLLRDPQSGINGAMRMIYESAGLTGVPMFEIQRNLVDPADHRWEIAPRKIWYRKGSLQDGEAIRAVPIQGQIRDLVSVVNLANQFMDDETNLPLAAQGDSGSTSRQTAHGMSLLVNAVNIIFKFAAKSFDMEFTVPNLKRLYHWNMMHNPNENIKGDMRCVARGSSVLLVREILAQNLMMLLNLSATNEKLATMIRLPLLIRKLLQALQVEQYDLVLTDEEVKQVETEMAENPTPDPALEAKLQVAQMQQDTQLQIAEMNMKKEILKLAQQEEMTLEQINAQLERVRIETRAKERLAAAEHAAKERHGTGI